MTRTVTALLLLGISSCASAAQTAASETSPAPRCPQAAFLGPGGSAQEQRITCEIPGALRLEVQTSEREGSLLHYLDYAAWVSTDALVEAGLLQTAPGKPMGYLALPTASGASVAYFTRLPNGVVSVFADIQLARAAVERVAHLDPPRTATAQERSLMDARALALAAPRLQCTQTINTVVVPPPLGDSKDIWVYVLSAWSDEVMPLGGFEKFRLSADGQRILERMPYTRACMNGSPAIAAKLEGIVVSDVQSLTPTAIHAFLSRQYEKPLYVLTVRNDLTWKVESGEISLFEPKGQMGEELQQIRKKFAATVAPARMAQDRE